MKIAKNREQCTETSNVGGKQEHEAPFFILIFIFLSNSGNERDIRHISASGLKSFKK